MIDLIVQSIAGMNYPSCRNESELEDEVVKRLTAAGIKYERQFVAGPGERFDILVAGGIVLELKVDGSAGALLRQITRYAQFECVSSIIAVTTRASHRQLATIGMVHGKRVGVVHVGSL